jgi:hypothetical protein
MSINKKALLIGCNYINDPSNTLFGCINDVTNMANTLVDAFDYDLNNITILRDDSRLSKNLPTRSNILNGLNKLAQESVNLTEIWFHYSGHGLQVQDKNQDEIDGFDEVIMPSDFNVAGFIKDDEIFDILKKISSNCRVILLFDCCHSGSVCDLQYGFQTNGKNFNLSKRLLSNPNIICFSGCKDSQTSADSYSYVESRSVGAFTAIFLYCLRLNHYNVDVFKLYLDLCNIMFTNGFQQTPQLSCSSPIINIIFERITYRDIATLTNPEPKLLNTPISNKNSLNINTNNTLPNTTAKQSVKQNKLTMTFI